MTWRSARGRPASNADADSPPPAAGLRELLERQRVELEGHVAEAERRLREREEQTAQAEQRAESAERRAVEVERKLKQMESRAVEAERKLGRSEVKGRAARRLAEATREAEQARAEAEDMARERALLERRVAELEGKIDELQRAVEGERSEREAREADLLNRLAVAGDEHGREHTMRVKLEQQLAAEVAERQRIEGQFEALEQSHTGPALGGEHEPSELERARSEDDDFAVSAGPTSNGPLPLANPARPSAARGRRLPFAPRWRRRSSLPCAVCRRPRPAMSEAEATASGWELAGAGALCPTCRREGWQFPPGATVPFRASRPRSPA